MPLIHLEKGRKQCLIFPLFIGKQVSKLSEAGICLAKKLCMLVTESLTFSGIILHCFWFFKGIFEEI